jgi:hypothetical protein
MSTSLAKSYQVRPDDQITLAITVGHGQLGTTTVHLEQTELVKDYKEPLELILPDKGKNLDGKTLKCSTVVAAYQKDMKDTSVTYQLKGGVRTLEHTLKQNVTQQGQTVFYSARFSLYI